MKERLDVLLIKRGLAQSREKAKAVIMSGIVYVNGQKEDKAGTMFNEEKIKSLEVRGNTLRYVSRGGLKLEKALNVFDIKLEGKICIDIGASTGGFTDCMLQNGAVKVYAIDSGHNQLAWKLRNDMRVICMEGTNFRYIEQNDIVENIGFASADVSFISLDKILGPAYTLLEYGAHMVCLIKPQFEAGREKVGKNGVIKDPIVHQEVIEQVVSFTLQKGFILLGLDFSPIKGPEGNIEYLMHICKSDLIKEDDKINLTKALDESYVDLIQKTVKNAHETLDN